MSIHEHPAARERAASQARPAIEGARTHGVPAAQAGEKNLSKTGGRQPLVTGPVSRRHALGLFGAAMGAALFAAPLRALAAEASKETLEALDKAQKQYEQVQTQLEQIATEYAQLASEQAQTQDQIEQVQAQVDSTQAEIDATQKDITKRTKELEKSQDVLAERMASTYKTGDQSFLSVLLSSSSFDQLISNVFYMNKVNESDRALIEEVKDAKAALEEKKFSLEQSKAALEQSKSELEALNQQQTQQLNDMQAKKDEVTKVLSGLSDDVQKLISQRDNEILEAQKAEEEERRRAEEEAKKAAEAKKNGTSSTQKYASASEAQQAVVAACKKTGSPGAGLCAMWCSMVYQAAGLGYPGGNANDMYAKYCSSSNKSDLKVGMLIAVSTHPHTTAGRIYGHVGIYIGDGLVMDNIGYIRTIGVNEWISYYSSTVPARWGFANSQLG